MRVLSLWFLLGGAGPPPEPSGSNQSGLSSPKLALRPWFPCEFWHKMPVLEWAGSVLTQLHCPCLPSQGSDGGILSPHLHVKRPFPNFFHPESLFW